MRRLRTRKSVVVLCVAVVVFAALLPAASSLFVAILTPLWPLLFAVSAILIRRRRLSCDEQPVSLLSFCLSRGPPASVALA